MARGDQAGRRRPTTRERKLRRRARSTAEERAHEIASRVYSVALDVGEDATYPLALQAPVQSAAEIAAARIVAQRWPDADEEGAEALVAAVVAYLLAGFFAMALEYDPEHHDRYRTEMGEGDDGARETAAPGGAQPGE